MEMMMMMMRPSKKLPSQAIRMPLSDSKAILFASQVDIWQGVKFNQVSQITHHLRSLWVIVRFLTIFHIIY